VRQNYLGSLLKDVQLSGHGVHTPRQTGEGLAILTRLLTCKQLLELVEPVLLIQLLTDQQLVEAAHWLFLAFFLTGKKLLELAHGVDLAGGQIGGALVRGAWGKWIRAAASSPVRKGSSCGKEGDVISWRTGWSFCWEVE